MRKFQPEIKKENQKPIDNQVRRMESLLQLEEELRLQKTQIALSLWAVNELRNIINYSQCILFRTNRSDKVRITAVSSLSTVDRNAPVLRWLEEQITQVMKDHDFENLDKPIGAVDVQLTNPTAGGQSDTHAFRQVILLPFNDRNEKIFGGLLITRNKPWQESEKIVATRLAGTISHAFQALVSQKRLRFWSSPTWLKIGLPILVGLAMFIPVPMTTLAPAEIVADDPEIVAAPINGVVSRILKDTNEVVEKDEILFEFVNTELKAAVAIARRKELVSQARLSTAKQAAFTDTKVYRQLAIAKAEVELAMAERMFAEQKLSRTIVRAKQAGWLIYTNRREWVGKPVKVGEQVMEIVDPSRVTLRVYLPVADAINLTTGAKIKLFLDANPLDPVSAVLRNASYRANEQPGVGLVYRITADFAAAPDRKINLRIGLRGTAQIFSEKVALGFYLFRRPISTFRQYFGI